jgi:RNA polymerase-interacting CarD/CdnL/TRCF family regulator
MEREAYMFKERDRIMHPIHGYGEIISIKRKRKKNDYYNFETTYEIYFNHGIRKIRDSSVSFEDIKLVDRSL